MSGLAAVAWTDVIQVAPFLWIWIWTTLLDRCGDCSIQIHGMGANTVKKRFLLFISSFCISVFAGGTNPVDSIKELLREYPANPKYLNDLAEFLLEESSYQAVDSLAGLALTHATDQRNTTQHARAQFLIGEVAWYEKDMERAMNYYRHSAENFEDAGELMYAAQSFNNLATSVALFLTYVL